MYQEKLRVTQYPPVEPSMRENRSSNSCPSKTNKAAQPWADPGGVGDEGAEVAIGISLKVLVRLPREAIRPLEFRRSVKGPL